MLTTGQALSLGVMCYAVGVACQGLHTNSGQQQNDSSPFLQETATADPPVTQAYDPHCEVRLLHALGWQQAHDSSGYSITSTLPANLTEGSWLSLGCLCALVNLTLTGSIPQLPDMWATNSSFPALQSLSFAASSLVGTLPGGWGQPSAFPQLQNLNLSFTQLSVPFQQAGRHLEPFLGWLSLTFQQLL